MLYSGCAKNLYFREERRPWQDEDKPERNSSSQLDTVTIVICLYQNKLPKIVPQIQSYDKYLQGYMREAGKRIYYENCTGLSSLKVSYSIYNHYYYTVTFLSHAVSFCDIGGVSTQFIYICDFLWQDEETTITGKQSCPSVAVMATTSL